MLFLHFHIDPNAPCLPPKMLRNRCFQFLQMFLIIYSYLLSNTAITREGGGGGGG